MKAYTYEETYTAVVTFGTSKIKKHLDENATKMREFISHDNIKYHISILSY